MLPPFVFHQASVLVLHYPLLPSSTMIVLSCSCFLPVAQTLYMDLFSLPETLEESGDSTGSGGDRSGKRITTTRTNSM